MLLRGGEGLFCRLGSGGGGLAAALGFRRRGGRFADQFRTQHAGDEQLGAVVIEVDRGTVGIGRGDDSQTEEFVFNGLAFLHYLHNFLLENHVAVD